MNSEVVSTLHLKTNDTFRHKFAYSSGIAHARFFLILLITFITLTVTMITINVQGQTEPATKLYTTISVEEGDTLWDIAKGHYSNEYPDFNAYIDEVKQINGMKDDNIKKGSYLVIPYYVD